MRHAGYAVRRLPLRDGVRFEQGAINGSAWRIDVGTVMRVELMYVT